MTTGAAGKMNRCGTTSKERAYTTATATEESCLDNGRSLYSQKTLLTGKPAQNRKCRGATCASICIIIIIIIVMTRLVRPSGGGGGWYFCWVFGPQAPQELLESARADGGSGQEITITTVPNAGHQLFLVRSMRRASTTKGII